MEFGDGIHAEDGCFSTEVIRDEMLEDVMLDEEYNINVSDVSTDSTLPDATEALTGQTVHSDISSCSAECRTAKRNLVIAVETFDQTKKVIENERLAALKAEHDQQKRVKHLRNELMQIFELQSTGIPVGNNFEDVKNKVEVEEMRLGSIQENNRVLFSQYEALEEALVESVRDKEQRLLELTQTSAERELADIRREMLQFRQAAYDKTLIAMNAREKAMSCSLDADNDLSRWAVASDASKTAKAAWFRVLSISQYGLLKAADEDKGWWARTAEIVKNALHTETVAYHWIEARKAEYIFRFNSSAALPLDTVHGSDGKGRTLWEALWKQANETTCAWHMVSKLFREFVNDVDEVFHTWWSEKLVLSEEVEGFWADLTDAIHDFNTVNLINNKRQLPPKKCKDESVNFIDFNFNGDVGYVALRIESLKSRALNHSFIWDDGEGLVSENGEDRYVDPTFNQIASASISRKESETHLRLRSYAHMAMSEDMRIRQETAISGCFREADVCSKELLQSCDQRGGIRIAALAKIAHIWMLNNAAIRNYRDMVRFEAIEDAKMDPEEARIRREDWRKRVAADSLVVFDKRLVYKSACTGGSYLQKTAAKRDYLRAKAILQADEEAFNAAWSIKLTDTIKRLVDVL